jgi:hypothetical protein
MDKYEAVAKLGEGSYGQVGLGALSPGDQLHLPGFRPTQRMTTACPGSVSGCAGVGPGRELGPAGLSCLAQVSIVANALRHACSQLWRCVDKKSGRCGSVAQQVFCCLCYCGGRSLRLGEAVLGWMMLCMLTRAFNPMRV